jgi:serine/threonine protein kinase/Tol biopolymer transport system component
MADGAGLAVPPPDAGHGVSVSGEPDWARIKAVFQSALEQPAGLRSSFVIEACGGDHALQIEVESLLSAHDTAGTFASGEALASLSTAALHDLSASGSGVEPGSRIGVYEVLGLVGHGSMGQVFKAWDSRLDRTVALKVLSPELALDPASRVRFEREAKTIASLRHPHICALFDVGHGGQVDYLVMEYLEGETLAAALQRGALPLDATTRYATQIIAALDAAHGIGVVHRDLKPTNVMITPFGVTVLDFGIAKIVRPTGTDAASADATHATRPDAVIGTAGYMSPEQARGQMVDQRADIWAFGCLLFEMLSGRPAFARDTIADTLVAVLDRGPDWSLLPPGTPRSLMRLLRRCLEPDASRRLRAIADARADIEDSAEPIAAAGDSGRTARRSRLMRAVPWVIAAAAIGVAALVTLTQATRRVAPQPLRLSVVPPEGTTWAPFDISGAPQFALSPDGTKIALVVADTDQVPRLWVRTLDATSGRTLSGTDFASAPFWSPDGSAIAFFADRKLKRVSVGSGLVQNLAEITRDVLPGGSWGPDGTIIFGAGRGLMRTSAEGGPVNAVTSIDISGGETFHGWPQFLPDGRRFLFYVRNRDRSASGTYLASLDAPGQRFVLASAVRALYAPTGHLLFERAGNLMVQPFDDTSATLTGQAVALPDRVVALPAPSWLPASVGEHAVAYWSGDGRPTFHVTMVDRSGRVLQQVLPPGQYLALALSPEGSRALVTERIDSQNDGLFTIDLSTGARTRITLAPGIAHFGVWAPDGDRVIFSSTEDGAPRLYRKDVRGNRPKVAIVPSTPRQVNMFPTDWSEDGQWVPFMAPGPTAWDVFALRMLDSTVRALVQSPQNQIQARLSPNGRWVAYASDESGRFEVYVQAFDDASDKTLVSTSGGSQPMWRRDGRELFYLAADGTMTAIPVTSESRFQHGAGQALFPVPPQGVLAPFPPSYGVSADGKRFLIMAEQKAGAYRTVSVVVNALINRE